MENPEGESLTSMTVCVGRTVTGTMGCRRTLGRNMETHRRRVSDRHDGHAGRTVVGMTVRHMCPLEDTLKKWETLRNKVSNNQNGCAGWTFIGTTVPRMCPLVDTWRKLVSGVLGLLERTQWRSVVGTTVSHRGLVLSFSDRTGDAPFIPYDPNGIVSVLTYIYVTQLLSKLAMLKHLLLEL